MLSENQSSLIIYENFQKIEGVDNVLINYLAFWRLCPFASQLKCFIDFPLKPLPTSQRTRAESPVPIGGDTLILSPVMDIDPPPEKFHPALLLIIIFQKNKLNSIQEKDNNKFGLTNLETMHMLSNVGFYCQANLLK